MDAELQAAFGDKCWDAAFDVVRRYVSFESYGTEAKAVKALHRRCPEHTAQECAGAFAETMQMFTVAQDVVARHADTLWQQFQTTQRWDLAAYLDEVQQPCPAVPVAICAKALSWVWYFHHMR